jgi:phospholipase/carboxylesterase
MESTSLPQLVQTGPEWFEAGLAYRYLQPDGPGPYPTVVLLHGRLGNEDVMWLFRHVIPRPWLVFAPRAPLAEQGGGFSWHVQPYGQWPELAAFDPAVAALTRFLRALPRLYNADPERLYLMGFSQGAAVAYAAALSQPNITRGIAGLVGFVPRVQPEAIAGRLNGLPVFMAVGEQDPIVPYAEARRSAEALRQAGADLEYHEYPTEHKLTASGIDDLRAWLYAQH